MKLADRVERLEHLITLIKQMLAADEANGLFAGLLGCVSAFTAADRGFVLFSETGRPQVRAALALDRTTVRSEPFRRSRRIADHVLETGQPFISPSLARDDRFAEVADDGDDRAVAVVPLRSGDRAVGAVYVDRPAGDEAFDPDDLGLLQELADISVLGIDARHRVRQLRSSRDELRLVNMTLERMATSLQEDVAAKSVELSRFERDLDVKNRALRSTYTFKNIVGRSPQMHRVFDILNQVMDYPVPVLITGESGTGKELIARALHHGSLRADEPFMAINCAAIPENLLESELFGFKRGAFTGATSAKEGLFIAARKGTVFLDEIGEMPLSIQAKLLRVLQEKEVRPIGGRESETVEARIVAATNRELKAEVAGGRFREDLYYRLNVVEVAVPPLRDRFEDIPALAEHFLRRVSEDVGVPRKRLSPAAAQKLVRATWPGNVRQLENAIKSSALLSRTDVISADELRIPDEAIKREPTAAAPTLPIGASGPAMGPAGLPVANPISAPPEPLSPAARRIRNRAEWEAHERQQILEALVRCGWNKTQAARELNVSRRNLYRKIDRYGIEGQKGSGG
ncbi:MAG: sigma-54-dependent Fis family transcriptional regulator [bacterium]